MSLDTQDIKLITDLQGRMEGRLVDAIKGQGSGMRATMTSEIDRIEVLDKIRNDRIGKNEDDVEILQNETRGARFLQRKPVKTIIVAIVIIALISLGASKIDVEQATFIIHNVIKIFT